jgi:hypothetical protein
MSGRGALPATPSSRVSRGSRSAQEPPSLGAACLGEAGSLAPPQAQMEAVRRRAKQTRAATTGGLSHAAPPPRTSMVYQQEWYATDVRVVKRSG